MIKVKKEFKELIPPLKDEEYNMLEQSILQNGITDSIQVWNNIIVDGHNRYEIAQKHNLEIETIELEFDNENQVIIYILEKQLGRRNITSFVRLELSDLLEIEIKKKAKEQQGKRTDILPLMVKCESNEDIKPIHTQEKISKIAGVSKGIKSQFDKIKDKIDDTTKEKLRTGKVAIGNVYKKVKNEEYKEKESILKDTSNIKITNDDIKIYNCDISKSDEYVEDNSLDVIITDPPYPRSFLHCWKYLAEFAVKKLKDGGVVVAMSGQSYIPEVLELMKVEGLNYYWTECIYTPGKSPNLQTKRLMTHWKPLFIFVKGQYTKTFQKTDVYISDYKDTKQGQEYHKWGQSLSIMDKIINDWSYVDDLICDPFLGGGTTALSCINNKRKFVGLELGEEVFNIAKKRINDYGYDKKKNL